MSLARAMAVKRVLSRLRDLLLYVTLVLSLSVSSNSMAIDVRFVSVQGNSDSFHSQVWRGKVLDWYSYSIPSLKLCFSAPKINWDLCSELTLGGKMASNQKVEENRP